MSETIYDQLAGEFIASMQWKEASNDVKELVTGNIRGFAAMLNVRQETAPPSPGTLLVGTDGKGNVVVNHPDIEPDKDGNGHIVFSPLEACHLSDLLREKAYDAQREMREGRK